MTKPTDTIKTPLNFADAMRALIDGREVRRPDWPKEDYGLLHNGIAKITRDGILNNWIFS